MNATLEDADALQHKMERVRMSLRAEVHGLVQNARTMTDWHYYWRAHPLACCGATAALAFLLVPSGRNAAPADVEGLVRATEKLQQGLPRRRASLASQLAGMATGLAVQAGARLLGRQIERLLSDARPRAAPPEQAMESEAGFR